MKQTEKRLPERGEGLGRAASRDGRDVRPSRRGAGPTGSNVGLLTAHLMSRTEVLGNCLVLRVRDFNKHTSGDPVAHGFSGTLACHWGGGGAGAGELALWECLRGGCWGQCRVASVAALVSVYSGTVAYGRG